MTKTINILLLLFLIEAINSHAQVLEQFQSSVNKKFGFINVKTNDTVVLAKYDNVLKYSHGIAPVRIGDHWAYINLKGEEVTPFKYELTYEFYSDLAVVYAKSNYGFIDTLAREVIPLMYSSAEGFDNGYCVVALNNKYGLIDKQNIVVIDFQYSSLQRYGSDTLYRAILNNRMALITRNGLALTPFMYDLFIENRNKYIVVYSNGVHSVIDKCGSQQDFTILSKQSNSYNLIVSHNKYGYIDNKDDIVVLPKYDFLGDFYGHYAIVCKGCKKDSIGNAVGGKWGLVDTTGVEVLPILYDCVKVFKHDQIAVCIDGRLHYVVIADGKVIVLNKGLMNAR